MPESRQPFRQRSLSANENKWHWGKARFLTNFCCSLHYRNRYKVHRKIISLLRFNHHPGAPRVKTGVADAGRKTSIVLHTKAASPPWHCPRFSRRSSSPPSSRVSSFFPLRLEHNRRHSELCGFSRLDTPRSSTGFPRNTGFPVATETIAKCPRPRQCVEDAKFVKGYSPRGLAFHRGS